MYELRDNIVPYDLLIFAPWVNGSRVASRPSSRDFYSFVLLVNGSRVASRHSSRDLYTCFPLVNGSRVASRPSSRDRYSFVKWKICNLEERTTTP